MKVNDLLIKNFRSYDEFSLTPEKNAVAFVGPNGAGKTNILESLQYASSIKSTRAKREEELVKSGENFFFIKVDFEGVKTSGVIEIGFDKEKRKKFITFNGMKLKLVSDAVVKFKAVSFMSNDILLIIGSPALRRNFIDSSISLVKPEHRKNLIIYKSNLKERNAWLKSMKENNVQTDDLWKDKLIHIGAKIISERIKFIAESRFYMTDLFYKAYGERLNIFYRSHLKRIPSKEDEIKNFLEREFDKVKDREEALGITLIGPHRDDLALLTSSNYNASEMLSQGQMRFLSLCLKAGIINYIQKETDELPVLLMDDVLLEIDESRKNILVSSLPENTMVFFAFTSTSELPKRYREAEIHKWIDGKWVKQI